MDIHSCSSYIRPPLIIVSYGLLLKITGSCPSEAVEFTCSNCEGPVVVWTITSTSGFPQYSMCYLQGQVTMASVSLVRFRKINDLVSIKCGGLAAP